VSLNEAGGHGAGFTGIDAGQGFLVRMRSAEIASAFAH
jgi:hypothetical protein